jgi:hypothetical protein
MATYGKEWELLNEASVFEHRIPGFLPTHCPYLWIGSVSQDGENTEESEHFLITNCIK